MNKKKIIIFAVMVIITIPICILLSNMIHLTISGEFMSIAGMNITSVIENLFENEKQFRIYLLLQTLFILFFLAVIFIQKDNIYESEIGNVTSTIKTPLTIGQGQYGTSRWLKEKEYEKVFDKNTFDASKSVREQNFKSGGLIVGYKKLKNNNEEIFYIGENTHSLTVRCYKEWKNKVYCITNYWKFRTSW